MADLTERADWTRPTGRVVEMRRPKTEMSPIRRVRSRRRRERDRDVVLEALGVVSAERQDPGRPARADDVARLLLRMTERELGGIVARICERDLSEAPMPYVHFDVSLDESKRPDVADVVTVTGVTSAGEFEPLGLTVGDVLDPDLCRDLVEDLVQRGLHGVRIVGVGDHPVLGAAVAAAIPKALRRFAEDISELSLGDALGIVRDGRPE